MIYLTIDQVIQAHDELLKKYGGSQGIRDRGLLESAVHRPQSVVFASDAYPTLFDKSGAICHSLLLNRPFIDGNKRAAFAACHLTLLLNGVDLTADLNTIYDFLIRVITDHLDWEEISGWLEKNSKKI